MNEKKLNWTDDTREEVCRRLRNRIEDSLVTLNQTASKAHEAYEEDYYNFFINGARVLLYAKMKISAWEDIQKTLLEQGLPETYQVLSEKVRQYEEELLYGFKFRRSSDAMLDIASELSRELAQYLLYHFENILEMMRHYATKEGKGN